MNGYGLIALALAAGLASAPASGATGQDPPVAQPAPYRVFFDWGKTALSPDGTATLDEAAAAALRDRGAGVTIVGHSDRSGADGSNRASALHRAEAVGDYLVAHGVQRSALRISSRGEDAPLIATADGVREPQNRRVDVEVTASTAR